MNAKRYTAGFLPYFRKEGRLYAYLQMRDEHAQHFPNSYGFFGGHIEAGETPEEAVVREVMEELEFELNDPKLLKYYERTEVGMSLFALEVEESFGDTVRIHEGKFGKFLPFDSTDDALPPHNREILKDAAIVLSAEAEMGTAT